MSKTTTTKTQAASAVQAASASPVVIVVEGDPSEAVVFLDGECDVCGRHSEHLTEVVSRDPGEVLEAGIWECPACRREALEAEEARESLIERVDDLWDRRDAHAAVRRACQGRR